VQKNIGNSYKNGHQQGPAKAFDGEAL